MRILELVKEWTGSGYGASNPRVLTQIKRNQTVALYSRTIKKTGASEGFEVFKIKTIKAGTELPGGFVEPEDREQYPSDNAFGRHAWHVSSLERANQLFDELTNGKIEVPKETVISTVEVSSEHVHKGRQKSPERNLINLPAHEFTLNGLVESSKASYPIVYNFVKEQLNNNSVKIVRTVPNESGKGRMINIYCKV